MRMANTSANSTATNKFDTTQAVRQGNIALIHSVNGVHCDRLVKHNDLQTIKRDGSLSDKCYAGLVPVVGGVERFDLALLTFDLLPNPIPSYPDGDKVVWFEPTSRLHTTAKNAPKTTYDAFLDSIVTAFAAGGTLTALTYPARNKQGGTYQGAVLGID